MEADERAQRARQSLQEAASRAGAPGVAGRALAGDAERRVERHDFRFHGSGTSFFLIFLKNVLLSLLTLGIYLAWAKTERRRYVWQNCEFGGQHFRYTGTGAELFKGYLVVASAYFLFFGASHVAGLVSPKLKTAVEFGIALGVLLLIPSIIYRARHYLYSRTSWRGIRFGLEPRAGEYTRAFLLGSLYTVLSLGLYMPIMTNRLHRIMTDNTRFGTLEFSYTGRDRDVWKMGVAGFFLSLVTLGLYYPWYLAKISRYRGLHTHVGRDARFDYQISGQNFLWIFVLNIWGTTLTLGLAFPWITMYSIRYLLERIHIEGTIDFEAIEQREGGAGAVADGFADAFDIGIGV